MTLTERLTARPQYAGMPIPYSVVVANGVPDFKATDMERWFECIEKKLCAICGERLDYWVWYIGGPACADGGVYFDLAMHEECAFFSASVCPFLAHGRDYATHAKQLEGYRLEINHSMEKSAVLFASKRRRDQITVIRDGGGYLVQTGPEVERIQIYPRVQTEVSA